MKRVINWFCTDMGSFWAAIGLGILVGLGVFAGMKSEAEEPSPWTYMGDNTYLGTFKAEYGLGVYMTCVMVRNPKGMAAGTAAISCK